MRRMLSLQTVPELTVLLCIVLAISPSAQATQHQELARESQKAKPSQENAVQSTEAVGAADISESPYLKAVREFADNVLKYGRDTYGPKHTPLFVDGINIHTHEPVKWISPKGNVLTATETEEWILSNFASQQTLLRTLDGLSTVTGDPKYRDAAKEAIKYAFENLRAPNGLFYWGHATAYDAQADQVRHLVAEIHVLKVHYPFYELLWQVNPEATKAFIEAYWTGHVINWSNLDFNRYIEYHKSFEEPWKHEYTGGPVFFKTQYSSTSGFFHTGVSLAQAGTTLHLFSSQKEPLIWSKRLIQRFIDTRHPNTGISAYVYNRPQERFVGGGMEKHFTDPRTGVFPSYPFAVMRNMYHPEDVRVHMWLGVLLIGDMLGDDGREFIQWALEELTAWGRASYRSEDNGFIPILTDGADIEGVMLEKDSPLGTKGSIAEPLLADAGYFWLYATAYRITGDVFMWRMARDIAKGNGFGDIGEGSGKETSLNTATVNSNVYSLLGFLELYGRTKRPEFLHMSHCIANNILDDRFNKGLFVLGNEYIYSRFDCFEPLALLHLMAAENSELGPVPRVWPSSPLFVPPYRFKQEGEDRRIIYTLTESSGVPWSLQEAAHIGDLDLVRKLLKDGIKPDSLDDGYASTALHRAAIAGHMNIAELLIAHGARVDHGGYNSTPLHCAIQSGHRDMAELLLSHGADVNIRDNWGRGSTPIHIAMQQDQKDITKLLITHGADVDLEDERGRTPLCNAVLSNDLEMVEFLISKDADVNARYNDFSLLRYALWLENIDMAKLLVNSGLKLDVTDHDGQTAFRYAVLDKQKELVDLFVSRGADVSGLHKAACLGDLTRVKDLVEEGADVNARDELGWTRLYWAASLGQTEVVEFLISKGADPNVKTNDGRTPLFEAAGTDAVDLIELLISKEGVDVNAKDNQGDTALHIAGWYGCSAAAELLISHGADIDIMGSGGGRPLHRAAYRGHKDLVELLLSHNADVAVEDNQHRTPLQLAQQRSRTEIVEVLAKAVEEQKAGFSNARKPANDEEMRYWLENMIWYHSFTDAEVAAATGLTDKEIDAAKKKFDIRADNRPEVKRGSTLRVLPYPGGRHPRIGFLEGAIDPQRETKLTVFTPWDPDSYVVVDVPEAIWSNLGLTYLAHTHIDTIWTEKGINLAKLEWKRLPGGKLEIERELPNGIAFGVKVEPTKDAVRMEMWLRNGTKQRLTDLRIQNCVMPKMAAGFEQQSNDNKVLTNPYAACRSADGKRWIITAWEGCYRTWANPDCPCFHSDPKFPDLAPGETGRLRGRLSFYEGTDIKAEFKRIEASGWRSN